MGIKLEGYFSLASLAHYLILDPDRRVVIHHARGREGVIETRILREGRLRLDPPGLEVAVAELFASVDTARGTRRSQTSRIPEGMSRRVAPTSLRR